ncbi:MAG: hypothetical protein IJV65_10270 [Kiritimatiellae bacterium]|nr:hypothetical protein [Kiritimatiellia bacterium]
MSPGASLALADNPGFADLVAALAAAPSREFRPIEPGVRAALAARAARAAFLRRAGTALAAAAAVAVAVLFAPAGERGAGAVLPQGTCGSGVAGAVLPQGPCGSGVAGAVLPQGPCGLADTIARQRLDGSWPSARGGEAGAPGATALAMLELAPAAKAGDSAAAEALSRGAAWLRAHQNPDGSFGAAPADSAAGAWNLALCAAALLDLYGAGGREDLFTPVDGAVGAVRDRLARPSAADLPLAAALALADSLEWPDAGDLRRAMRRLDVPGGTFSERRAALAHAALNPRPDA